MTFQDGDWRVPNQRHTFREWKQQVNAIVVRKVGLDADDLPDWGYADSYRNGDSPSSAANAAIKAAKSY